MTSPPHVALYLPSLRGGGAERVMVMLANGFAARGHRVDLVLAKAEGPYLPEVTPDVRIVDLNSHRVLASLPGLVAYLRRERPRAVLSSLGHANIVTIVARAVSGVKCRLVVSERNSLSGMRGTTGFVMRCMTRALYPRADAVVTVSRGVAEELTDLGLDPGLITAIPNPVDVDAIRRGAEQRLDHPWIDASAPPLFLAVGRLTAQKDYPTLLAAFARVRAQRTGRLVILGEGELRQDIQARIEALGLLDDVELLGFQPNPYPWMKACAAYVMSSAWEGFPNSLVQAMACGARVVSTDCRTGPDEILEGGKWGRLVPVGDAEALAEAMIATLDDSRPPEVSGRIAMFRASRAIDEYVKIIAE